MDNTWHYLINQFENATIRSYPKALKLSNYHDAYLNKMRQDDPSNPDWAMLYAEYHPIHQLYVANYTAWKNEGGQQQGQTLNTDQLLKLLTAKVNKWEALIQSEVGFEKGTANYLSIFPQGRFPFSNGGKTVRVEAVKVFAKNLDAYPAMAAVKTLVDTFYTQLANARDTQLGTKGSTKQKSQEVELQRIAVMTAQYRNLGFLIYKAADKPKFIEAFFDLNVLRESRQAVFTGTLQPNENEAILIHTFAADDALQLNVKSDSSVPSATMVSFYLASVPNGTDSIAVEVEANAAPRFITATDFGISNYAAHRYLTVVNHNAMELKYEVELI